MRNVGESLSGHRRSNNTLCQGIGNSQVPVPHSDGSLESSL